MTEEGTKAQRQEGAGGWTRRLTRVGVCVAAGAMLTMLTAAASLLYAPTTLKGRGVFSSRSVEGQAPGSVHFKPGQVYQGVGIRETIDYWHWIPSERPAPGEPSHITGAGMPTVNVGWPLLAFTSPPVRFLEATSYAEFHAAREHAYGVTTTTGTPEFLRARPHRVVPGRILPLEFTMNMLAYALFAGAVLFAPGAIRRGLRRRGGRCVGCGYPLTGGDRCPECGDTAPQGVRRRGRRGLGDGARPLSASGGTEHPRRDLGSTGVSPVLLAPSPFVPLCLCASVPSDPEATP